MISETPKKDLASSSFSLQVFDHVTTRGDQALIHIVLSRFRFSALRHSYGDEFLMLHVPISEAPKWILVALAPIISAFHISAFHDFTCCEFLLRVREVREPCSFDFAVGEMMICHHVSYGPNGLDLVMNSTLHGPSLCLIRDFGILHFTASGLL
jgi:hypothetical protein